MPRKRRKRLTHELWHLLGYAHWDEGVKIPLAVLRKKLQYNRLPAEFKQIVQENNGEIIYSTYPDLDSWSWILYFCVIKNLNIYDIFKNVIQ